MILIDFNQILLSNLFASIGNHHNIDISEDLVRHMFLNSIRATRKKFHKEYGEIIICCDSKYSWRKKEFPYYKANRKSDRESSEIDWNELHRIMDVVRQELVEYFPYKIIQIDGCEADDIIGTICQDHGAIVGDGNEKILIVSNDKDFVQLHTYSNVYQYDPIRSKDIRISDPENHLLEHILKGDSGDGIPNILSADNALALKIRQKPMTAKRMALFKESLDNLSDEEKERYKRNRKLIDLTFTPNEIKDAIRKEYNKEKETGRGYLYKFFMDKKLKNLMSDIQDF